ncbi:hypothetical protein BH11ARM2_BH11ARM2_23880 [soil metagenome]
MSTNIVALFDTPTEAQMAVRRLIDAGLPSSKISLIAKGDKGQAMTSTVDNEGNLAAEGAASGATSGTLVGGTIGLLAGLGLGVAVPFLGFLVAGPIAGLITGAVAGAATGGILGGLIGLGLPKEDAEYYAHGIESGGTLVVAEVANADIDRYEDILRGAGGANVHEQAGSATPAPAYAASATPAAKAMNEGYATTSNTAPAPTYRAETATPKVAGDRLEIVEEKLHVGKKEVESGGVRVRRFVTEKPVSAQVELREEHINIDRHAVDRPAGQIGADAFTDRTIEVRETAEVPVVSKEARVVEEVVIGKTAETRTETVSDTVRRTDVKVEQIGNSFRQDFDARYAGQNANFSDYEPSYQYGASLFNDPRYQGREYATFENSLRTDYQAKYPQSDWSKVKDAVRAGWEKARGNYGYSS